MVKHLYLALLLLIFSIGPLRAGQDPPKTQESKPPVKKVLSPEEVIQAFSTKESEFYDAWMQYSYRQTAKIRIVAVNGFSRNENMTIVSEVVFRDDGSREVQVVRRSGQLRSVGWTKEDTDVINNIQPFALTAKELPLYELKYEAKEKVDDLECYVFSVKPKKTRGDKLYFQGKIWVDDVDLQIVRTVGKPVPQRRDNQFPEFETIRQVIDDQYWFPTWTHADSTLRFSDSVVRVEETITYEDYRRFGSKAKIEFGPPKPE
jgi:hypothetical protein